MNCPLKAVRSEDPAWIDREKTWSFKELDDLADGWAARLQGACRVAVRMPSSVHLMALFFGAWRVGAAVCPINLRLPEANVRHLVEQIQPDLFLKDSKSSIFPDGEFCGLARLSSRKSLSYSVDPEAAALLLATSGSTAEPKIAALSLGNLLASAEGAIGPLDLRAGDRWQLNLPLFHVGGIGILIRCVLARAAVVLEARHATHISCVPTQLYRSSPVSKNLRCVLVGGAPIGASRRTCPLLQVMGSPRWALWSWLASSRPANT